MINGIINVYKERGFTSFDVVAKLRGILHERKIGHTGTLDPEATGVLPICIGNATKVCELLTDKDKVYTYEITEVKPTDGTTLKKVLISNDGTSFKDDTSFKVEKGSVNGTITADATNPVVEFQNNNKPTGSIVVTKKWKNTDGTEITDRSQLPGSIYLQLQRKEKDNEAAVWEAVDYSGNISEKNWVEVTPKYSGSSSYVWSYPFMDLEQYVDSAADPKVRWIYRVMEVNDKGEVIDSDGTYTVDEKTYRVTYSMDATAGTTTDPTKTGIELAAFATADVKQPTVNMTVTNTYLEELNLKITKKGKNTTDESLSGVEFKLEKKDSVVCKLLEIKATIKALPPLQNSVREPTD